MKKKKTATNQSEGRTHVQCNIDRHSSPKYVQMKLEFVSHVLWSMSYKFTFSGCTFATLPRTTRGVPIVLGEDPKGENFLYTNDKTVVIRNIEVQQMVEFFILWKQKILHYTVHYRAVWILLCFVIFGQTKMYR